MRRVAIALACGYACGRIGFDATTSGPDAFVSSVPSCAALQPTCGPAGTSDCCETLPVPGGSFFRGYDVASDGMFTSMAYAATISSYRLDKFEVTVGRFRQFVTAGMGTQASPPAAGAGAHPNLAASGWQAAWNAGLQLDTSAMVAAIHTSCMEGSGSASFEPWTDAPGPNENRPMTCMDWYEAVSFCIWDGGYLPTLAELMFAASGGPNQRAYPWSMPYGDTTIDSTFASYGNGSQCFGDGQPSCDITDLVEVGTKPAGDGAFGQSDLAGNVSELVLDWFIGVGQFPVPCNDCAQLADPGTGYRVTYEGGYNDGADLMRSASHELAVLPQARWHNIGIRCARP
jgi:formylglycine-generating enzyme required for sulfatase activity